MAKVTLNQLLHVLQGGIGDWVFRQMPDGTIIISGAPRYHKRKTTQKQQAHRERFRQAAKHARRAARKHPIYAELAKGTWKSAYNFALSDWWHKPEIHRIERKKGCIRVQATDNVLVARVRVTVLDEGGKILEAGECVKAKGRASGAGWWEFASEAQGKTVIAEAWDLPGNVTKFAAE